MRKTIGSMERSAAQALGMMLALSLGMLSVTCKSPLFGLGGAVDLVAPRSISISPGQGSVRSGVITISGVAQDSYGLAGADVKLLNKTTGTTIASFDTTVSSNSWTTASIDTAQFPDGPYTIAVTLKDARGNASEDRILITFDNRAPTVLIDTPLDLSLEYNGEIHVSGDSYDSLSAISKVTVSIFNAGALLYTKDSVTVPKWDVAFNAADPAFGLSTPTSLTIVVTATDDGGNANHYQYEYKPLYTANDNKQITVSQIDTLDGILDDSGTIPDVTFNKATLIANRRDKDASPATPTILKVNIDSDKPTFTFVTPPDTCTSEALAERYAGGTKANGTIKDDDKNTTNLIVNYRYALLPADIEAATWTSATVEGDVGYEQRWSFPLPGTNGAYAIQLQGTDNGGAIAVSGIRYVVIDDGRPLISVNTANSTAAVSDGVPWKLYYGANQHIFVDGSASRDGVGNSIEEVTIQADNLAIHTIPITPASSVSWENFDLDLTGIAGGSTQVRVRARDNLDVWGQTEVLIIMDVDSPHITINDPGANLNGTVTFRGSVADGSSDAFITVLDKVEAKVDSGAYTQITGTYSWSWIYNTQGLPDGAHTLWIKAYDTAGNSSETSLPFSVLQSTDKPSVTVNNLSPGAVVGGSYIVSGTAGDDDGIANDATAIQMLIEIESSPGVWAVQQSWSDVSAKTGTPASYSWTYPLPALPSGSYRLSVRTRDSNSVVGDFGSVALPQVNYWNTTGTMAFQVDNDVPVVNQAGFSPASGSYVKDSFALSGTITEDKSLASVRVFINGTDRGTATIGGTVPNFTFSFAVDKAWLDGADGSNSIRIDATDNSSPAKTGSGTVQIIYDSTAPAVNFLSPDEGTTVNGTLAVSGTASDDNQVASLYYAVAKTADPVPAFPAGYTLLVNQKYAFNFNIDTTLLSDKTAYKVYLVAVDGAGNDMATAPASPKVLNINVDQDSDRPIVKLSNIDPDGLPSLTTLKMSNTVFGSVSDDDGTLTKLEISEDESAWTEITMSGGTFSYDSSAGDGTKTLYFRATDKNTRVFATNAAASGDKPRIENGAPGVYIESAVSYKVDTNFPDVYSTLLVDPTSAYDFADGLPLITNMSFGGATGVFKVRTLATDASGIHTVKVFVPGATGSPFAAIANGTEVQGSTTYTRYDSGLIDVTGGIVDGAITVTIEVEDNSGLKTTVMRTILVDNTAPLYTVTTPANNEVVNGDITIKGTALDQTAGLKSVSYKLGYNYDTEDWTPVGGSMYSWEIALTGANRSDLYAGKTVTAIDIASDTVTSPAHGFAVGTKVYFSGTPLPGGIASTTTYYVIYATANDFRVSTTALGSAVDIASTGSGVFVSAESKDVDNDQIWEFPVLIRAEDNAGNIAVTTLGDYMIKLDPGGDRPRVTVYYPDPADPTKTLGGTIRVYGMATDDDAVDSVYMQIDVNNDGLFDASDVDSIPVDWYNGGLGQQVIGSANWYRTINESGEFNPVVDTRVIKIRLRGKDIYGTYGAWTAAQPITIDKNVPQFGSSSPMSIDPDSTVGNGNEQPYSVGMYVNGTTVYMRGSVTDDGGITDIQISGAITGSLADNPAWFNAWYEGHGYDLAIPISLPADASGSKQFTITAYDNSAVPRESVYEVRINYDNQVPVGTLNASASPAAVVQSNGWYKVKGTAEDVGSDIDHVEVYFVRRGNGSTTFDRIYNPGTQNTSVPLSSIDFTGSYPTLKGTASRASLTSLTSAALIGNAMIVNGQRILVGANLRTISTFNPTTGQIAWTGGDVPLTETAYTIRLALQVDHKDTVESSVVASGSVTRTVGQEKTLVAPALIGNTDIAVGDTLRIAGQYRIVATWNSASGTITWAGLDVAVGVNQAYEVFSVINDDGDHDVEYLKQDSGITYTWSVDIKSDAMPDGPIEIHYVVFDKAGNSVHSQTTGYKIQNNGPRMAAIILGADLNDDGTVSSGEKQQFDYSSDIVASETKTFPFLVKEGPMYIEPVVTNGNGDLKLWMTGAFTLNNYALRTNDVLAPITLTDADLVTIGDGSRTFTLTIWDSTEETTVGSDSLNIVRGATIDIDYIDGVPPTVAIRPFYWNGSLDNSLYGSARANGHIEIAGVYDGTDPDVSGQISIRGVAYDDQRIESLYAYIDGFTFTGAPSTKVIGSYTYALVASYAAGVWTPTDQWAANGWKVSISDTPPDQSGHRISWQLDWDSAKVSGVAAANRVVRIVAEDKAGSPSPATDSANTLTGTGSRPTNNSLVVTPNAAIRAGQLVILGSGEQAYASRIGSYSAGTIVFSDAIDTAITAYTIYLDSHQKASYQVDVVPYIAKITTSLDILLGEDYNRSANGKYPVRVRTMAPASYETILVNGFNLYPTNLAAGALSDIRLSKDPDGYDASYTTKVGSGLAGSGVDADFISLNTTIQATGSGFLTVITNGVPSINNINQNITENNTEPSLLQSSLNDDRYLSLWDFTPLRENAAAPKARNAIYPSMVIAGTTPQFAYVNNAGGYGLAEFWSGAVEQKIYENWDLFTFTSLALNADNNRAALYDINVVQTGTDFIGDKGGITVNFFYNPPNTTWNGTTYFYRDYNVWLDNLYRSGNLAVLDRYLFPTIKLVGTNSLSHVFYSVYDSIDDRIIFRYFRIGTDQAAVGGGNVANANKITDTATNLYLNKNDLNQSNQNATWPTYTDSATNNQRFAQNNNSGNTNAGQYFATGLGVGAHSAVAGISTGASTARAILVYYSSNKLYYVYATNDANTTWSAAVELDSNIGGDYVSMVVDKDGHVHIAYQDSFAGDVKYIYIPTYSAPATRKKVTVDAYLTIGEKLTLTVPSTSNTPYLAYKGLGNTSKIAWYSGTPDVATLVDGINAQGELDGAWEVQVMPTRIVDSDTNRYSIGVGTDGKPVVGYSNNQSGSKGIEYLTGLSELPN